MIIKEWSYDYHLSKHFDWIFAAIKLSLITNAIIAFVIILADIKNSLHNLYDYSFIFFVILGVYLISSLITFLINKGLIRHLYVIKDNELLVYSANVVDIPINHEMFVNKRIGKHIDLKTIKRIELIKHKNIIKITGPLTKTNIYANDNEIDDIYELLLKMSNLN